jgi:hypothetical protein
MRSIAETSNFLLQSQDSQVVGPTADSDYILEIVWNRDNTFQFPLGLRFRFSLSKTR